MAKANMVSDLGDAELFERLAETKEELFNLRFQRVTGQLDNYARIKSVKKEVARLFTELRSREIAAAEALQASNTASTASSEKSSEASSEKEATNG